ncbi:hypothetical protein [Aestuariicoccus sp. MJ-SS9]|uniref:hypothetical protein n=1 Tax=Aestuariicoccus sp. MJ-SS9 TaxID=3079855 RepID=UPI00290F0C05|nr:hypothetical protein [Aestuariicoccus sp. MJ-SS9]MDU8910842.1 hypothetical protein [Aestuariicoccus sp. MJ-SS9]
MTWWEQWNSFLSDNQALTVAVGIPILTAIAAGIVSLITTIWNLKAQRLDREQQRKLWIANSEKENLRELREIMAKFEITNFAAQFDIKSGLSSGIKNHLPREEVAKVTREIIEFMVQIELRVPSDDPEFSKLALQ